MNTVKTSHKSWREEKMKGFLKNLGLSVLGGILGAAPICAITFMATRPSEDMVALSLLLQEHPGTIVQMDNAIIGSLPDTGNLFLLTAPAVNVYEDEGYRPLPCVKAPADAPFCTEAE